jgi:hypothetical protein
MPADTSTPAATIGAPPVRASRAADRPIDPGNDAVCVRCGERVKFAARSQARQVIANVYDDNRWQRVEHFHASCYDDAGHPYGEAS